MSQAIYKIDPLAPNGRRRVDTGAVGPPGEPGVNGADGSDINAQSIRGVNVAATAPTTGQALVFNGTNYVPGAVASSGSLAIAAQVSGDKCVGGVATASSTYTPGNFLPSYAFDNIDSTRWSAVGKSATLNYNRGNGNGAVINAVKIYPHTDQGVGTSEAPRTFKINARTNGGAYTTLLTVTNQVWNNTDPVTFPFINTVAFTEFQLEITTILGSNASIRKIEFLGQNAAGAAGAVTDFDKLNLNQISAPTAATTLGNIVKRIEIFDASGISLGFIPVYATIT